MTTNLQKVEAFIEAWNRCDGAAIISAFAPDAVYHNIPMEPIHGRDAIGQAIEGLLADMSDVQWIVSAIAEAADGTVLTERVDAFKLGGKAVSLPVMGTFVFRDGLIVRWADYFDLASYRAQLGG